MTKAKNLLGYRISWNTRWGSKRIGREFEKFREFAEMNLKLFSTPTQVNRLKNMLMKKYNLNSDDATNLLVYINGAYNNDLYWKEFDNAHYELGKKIAVSL